MKIIFFDGLCPMCNSWVLRILRWDKKGIFKFAPLESEIAKKTLGEIFPGYMEENTIVLYDEGKISIRSDAGLNIGKQLAFPFNLSKIGFIVPKFIRDKVYTYIANRRYTYGERYDSCPMPPPEYRGRFL